jgi:hypothetical protein
MTKKKTKQKTIRSRQHSPQARTAAAFIESMAANPVTMEFPDRRPRNLVRALATVSNKNQHPFRLAAM